MSDLNVVSIGELSKRTGISVLRLRAWESRYGIPKAEVLESGHRRYTQAEVNSVVVIAQLLEKGYRIGKIAELSLEERVELISNKTKLVAFDAGDVPHTFQEVIDFVLNFDEKAFISYWTDVQSRVSAEELLEKWVYPFLIELGEHWENGIIGVSHEHFASQTLAYFIESSWRQMNLLLNSQPTILALLPNEYHSFGLHFAALLSVVHGHRVVYLGERTPVEAIVEAVQQNKSRRLIISISETYDLNLARKYLKSLLLQIGQGVELWVGGSGAPQLEGVLTIKSIQELNELLGKQS